MLVKSQRMKKKSACLLFFWATLNALSQINQVEEAKILASVAKNNHESIKFLEKVVNINSGTMNPEGVKEVGMVFKTEFDNLGFTTRWVDLSSLNRGGHLFAETSGNKGKKLLLIGHLDTVFEKDSPFQRFTMLEDSIAAGPGANDMKGGNVIILYALKALQENGLLKNAQIIVAYTGDEENPGEPLLEARKHLIEAAKKSDIALGFETATGFNYATVARRGASSWKLEVEGKQAHSSGIFGENTGAGAIYEASRTLNSFYEELKGEEFLTFNPGLVLGGTNVVFDEAQSRGEASGKDNVVAKTAVVVGDLRFISEEQKNAARQRMKAIVEKSLPKTSATISFFDGYPAMSPTDGNYGLLKMLSNVSNDLGYGEVQAYDPGRRGAADVSFVAEYVDCLDGLGAMGTGAHSPNETVDLKTFEELTIRTAVFIYRLINN